MLERFLPVYTHACTHARTQGSGVLGPGHPGLPFPADVILREGDGIWAEGRKQEGQSSYLGACTCSEDPLARPAQAAAS